MRFGNGAAITVAAAIVAGSAGIDAQRPNVEAAVAAILKADRDFNQSVSDRNMNRFLSLIAEAATFGGGTPDEIHGRDAVGKAWARFFQADGPRLSWTPTRGEVIGSGDIGYTVGTWERRVLSATGQATVTRGNYLTVWKKQADGSWQAVYDTGSTF